MGIRGKLKAIVTIVLAIGLTSVFVGESEGSKPDGDAGDGSGCIYSSRKDDVGVELMESERGWR